MKTAKTPVGFMLMTCCVVTYDKEIWIPITAFQCTSTNSFEQPDKTTNADYEDLIISSEINNFDSTLIIL